MRLLELLKATVRTLEQSGIQDALPDAELIVFHAVGMERLDAYVNNPEVGSADAAKIKRLIRRRRKGEPVQYVTGSVTFLGLTIKVGKGVLIPRPETELLVEEVIKTIKSEGLGDGSKDKPACAASRASRLTPHDSISVLDLCTGSGCVALALAKEFPDAGVYGTDVSKEALAYARKNAKMNGIKNARFLQGSLLDPVEGRKFSIITANPPYIRRDELETLQREIRDWEPVGALDGGEDGMDFYRQILSSAGEHLSPGGCIFLELGFDQAGLVQKLAQEQGFKDVALINDYSGIGRILKARKAKFPCNENN
jgi:release factor glutamine methyltransferase